MVSSANGAIMTITDSQTVSGIPSGQACQIDQSQCIFSPKKRQNKANFVRKMSQYGLNQTKYNLKNTKNTKFALFLHFKLTRIGNFGNTASGLLPLRTGLLMLQK